MLAQAPGCPVRATMPGISLSQVAVAWIAVGLCVALSGCAGSAEAPSRCDGDACGCQADLYSYDANIALGDVPVEHASVHYFVPNAVKMTDNGTNGTCCDAIYTSILNISIANTTSGPCDMCRGSPNREVADAACGTSDAMVPSLRHAHHGARLAPAANAGVDDPTGQDCYLDAVGAEANVTLNGKILTSATKKLRIRWTDPTDGQARCCDALRPVLRSLLVEGRAAEEIPELQRTAFCDACKGSTNVAVALAAYRCFDRSGSNESLSRVVSVQA